MKNLEVFLRQFEEADLPTVLKIEKLSFAINPQPASKFRYYAQRYPEGFIVAEINEKVVGYVVGRVTDKKGKITRIAVDPKYRRERIEYQLTAYILNYFKEKKVKKVQVEVRTTNQGSIRFFKSFHFVISKILKKYYSDDTDAYLMELSF